ncbi:MULTISPECIES: hypothetical protein [unclassified Frankia]|uniref:hypothetical protein n=1 Tax=unclassified Frankia TaxID=2632575 RepID=UPI002025996C
MEYTLLWVDYRVVTAVRGLGLRLLYWPSEVIVFLAGVGLWVAAIPPTMAGVLHRRAGRIALIVAIVGLLTWNFSLCVPGGGCVSPIEGWWRFTSKLGGVKRS